MITYLTQQLNMPMVKASITLSNFGGLSSLTPLLGAFIADSFAGRFWTIVVATLIYELVNFLSSFQTHCLQVDF
jgi:peptide/histidine transporter 3/4